MDLLMGFYSITVAPESQGLTSFVTFQNQYVFNYLPMGLKVSPDLFAKCIRKSFAPELRDKTLIAFMDDLIVASKTFEEHLLKL